MDSVTESSWSIVGKVVIVTGANNGIGKFTALELAKRGAAKVILACRNMKAAEEAADEIRQRIGTDNKAEIVCRHVDLSSLSSVREFAAKINAEEPRLDVLVNNAGVLAPDEFTETPDGFELTFATNHLGHFLLTELLLDLMKRSGPGRIVIVSSEGYMGGWRYGLDLENIAKGSKPYKSGTAYVRSKWCNMLHARELAKRLANDKSGVTVYSLHPGVIDSGLYRNRSTLFQWLWWPFAKLIVSTNEQGAKTSVYCACEPGIEKFSGKYFKNSAKSEPWSFANDDNLAVKLWELSERLIAENGSK